MYTSLTDDINRHMSDNLAYQLPSIRGAVSYLMAKAYDEDLSEGLRATYQSVLLGLYSSGRFRLVA